MNVQSFRLRIASSRLRIIRHIDVCHDCNCAQFAVKQVAQVKSKTFLEMKIKDKIFGAEKIKFGRQFSAAAIGA